MPVAEPTPAAFRNRRLWCWLAATRPPFLLASLVPVLLGLAVAAYDGLPLKAPLALLTVIGALCAHAAVNVLNDYYDARNGSDAANTERLFPFTGGSRFIQNGVLTAAQTARLGLALLAVTVLIGLGLSRVVGPLLLPIGLAGLLIGWAYSAPPLALNSRGLGEGCVAVGFALLVIGSDSVQRGSLAVLPVLAAWPYAWLVAGLLLVNQFPDCRADAGAGKRHWVVRLGPARARWLYPALLVLAYGGLVWLVAADALPVMALLGLLSLPLSVYAAWQLLQHAGCPQRLRPAIQATIAAALAHGLLLAVGLCLA